MDYTPPLDGSGDDSYLNGTASMDGSAVPGEAIEHDQREIVKAIQDSGQTPSSSDLTQLSKAIQSQADLRVVFQTSSTTLGEEHRRKLVIVNNTSTITLPTAVGRKDFNVRIENGNTGTQVVTVQTAGGSLILPRAVVSSLKLPEPGDKLHVVSDGVNWRVLQWTALVASHATPAANFNVANATFVPVPLSNIIRNPLGEISPVLHTFVPALPGLYTFDGTIRFNSGVAAGAELFMTIFRNGVEFRRGLQNTVTGTDVGTGSNAPIGSMVSVEDLPVSPPFPTFQFLTFQQNGAAASAVASGDPRFTYVNIKRTG